MVRAVREAGGRHESLRRVRVVELAGPRGDVLGQRLLHGHGVARKDDVRPDCAPSAAQWSFGPDRCCPKWCYLCNKAVPSRKTSTGQRLGARLPTYLATLCCAATLSCGGHLDPPLDAGEDSGGSMAAPQGNGISPQGNGHAAPSTGSGSMSGGTTVATGGTAGAAQHPGTGAASDSGGSTSPGTTNQADATVNNRGNSGGATDADTSERLPPGPGRVLYTACNTLGALDCSLADPKIRLLCDGMTWRPIGVCTGQQVCDTSPGPNQGLCTGPDPAGDSGASVSVGDAAGAGVVLYDPCSTLGALQCSLKDPKIQVLCDGMTWNPIGVCTGQQVCNPLPGPNEGLCENP